ncbi:hypothetical protein CsSME_00022781 [Camellia sinensis var. sinensis]
MDVLWTGYASATDHNDEVVAIAEESDSSGETTAELVGRQRHDEKAFLRIFFRTRPLTGTHRGAVPLLLGGGGRCPNHLLVGCSR